MHKVLPEYLSLWTTEKVANEGVQVISNSEVKDVSLDGKQVSLHLSNGNKVSCPALCEHDCFAWTVEKINAKCLIWQVSANKVIVAVGVDPNTELAEKSGLEVEPELGGFLVNAELEARSNLYAVSQPPHIL